MASLEDLIAKNKKHDGGIRPQNTKKGFDALFGQNQNSQVDDKILNRLNQNSVPQYENHHMQDTSNMTGTPILQDTSKLTDSPTMKVASKLTATYKNEEATNLNNYLLLKNRSFYDLTKSQYKILEFIFNTLNSNKNGFFISNNDFINCGFNNGRLTNDIKRLKELGLIEYELKLNSHTKQKTNFFTLK